MPTIGPYKSQPAACRDYDPRAAAVARLVAAAIHDHLPHLLVEHIGSTSVPGCAGKGIVDLMVSVPDGQLQPITESLDRLGFQQQSGPDPFPDDRPMRVGSMVCDGETFLLHVHLIPAGSHEIDELRFFRTCLKSDPELLAAYVAKKRQIVAAGVTDSLDYCRQKGKFIKDVLG